MNAELKTITCLGSVKTRNMLGKNVSMRIINDVCDLLKGKGREGKRLLIHHRQNNFNSNNLLGKLGGVGNICV